MNSECIFGILLFSDINIVTKLLRINKVINSLDNKYLAKNKAITHLNISMKSIYQAIKLSNCGIINCINLRINQNTLILCNVNICAYLFEYFQKLQIIMLSNLSINNMPCKIYNLINLIKLSITDSNIITISKEIINLVNLKTLNLKSNKLLAVPHEIELLKKLQILDLSCNYILFFPTSCAKKYIKKNNPFFKKQIKFNTDVSVIGTINNVTEYSFFILLCILCFFALCVLIILRSFQRFKN